MAFRIGMVKYLNTLPLVQGLEAWREAELHAAVPSKLAGMLAGDPASGREPEVDVALVSVIDAARSAVPLAMLPVGMIGCEGPTLTVRLFSAVPPERIGAVHADTDSHTSVALCRVILARAYGVKPEVIDFDARERVALGRRGGGVGTEEPEWPETLLLIGDKVVTDSPPAVRYPHQLDLGEAWKALTGLPFVYAVWMCRAADAGSADVGLIADMLDRQRRRNTSRLDWIVDRLAAERGWPPDLARTYLGSLLRYEVGPREREAVVRFFDEAAGLGLIAPTVPRWAEARRVREGEPVAVGGAGS
ncbi:MAG: menaquinone biosynthesis protein [Phycisphaerae bacterium]|nr:menaquinone biosynthesis protein [Phycisphaerae bacterium]